MSEELIPKSDLNDLDDVIHILGIEDSHTTPVEAVAEMFGTITRLSDANAALLAALQYIANLEPGSRGAYSKFAQAKLRANQAIAKADGRSWP